jgi:hypothetical protein
MPKKVTANGKTFTFDDNVSEEEIGIAIDDFFANNVQSVDETLAVETPTPTEKIKKKEVSVSGSASLGGGTASPIQSTPKYANNGVSPLKNVDLLREANFGVVNVNQPKKEIKKTIIYNGGNSYEENLKDKISSRTPLDKTETEYVRSKFSNALPQINNLSDEQINQGLFNANKKNTLKTTHELALAQEEEGLHDRIKNGDVTPDDMVKAKSIGFFPTLDENQIKSLGASWNNEIKQAKLEVDNQIKNDVDNIFKNEEELNNLIGTIDYKIKDLQAKINNDRNSGNIPFYQDQLNKLEGIKSKAESKKKRKDQYLNDLSTKVSDESILDIIKKGGYNVDKDEKGLLTEKGRMQVSDLVEQYVQSQNPQKKFLLSYKNNGNEKGNTFLEEQVANAVELIPIKEKNYFKLVEEKTKNLPSEAKSLINQITGKEGYTFDKGFSKVLNDESNIQKINTLKFMEFKGIVDDETDKLETYINSPQVQGLLGVQLKSLTDQYNNKEIDGSTYRDERIKLLYSNSSTRPTIERYIHNISKGNQKYEDDIQEYINSRKIDYAKYTKVDKNGNVVSIAGMKPTEFVNTLSELGYGKMISDYNSAKELNTNKEDRGNEFADKYNAFDTGSTLFLSTIQGAHSMYSAKAKWLYDKTGIELFNDARKGIEGGVNTFDQLNESTIGKQQFNLETGDYLNAFNPNYIAHTFGNSLPYMAEGMAVGYATGGISEIGLLGLGLGEGVGSALALSKTGRIAQKVIAGMSGGGYDAFQNMQVNYDELIKQGYSVKDADRISKDAFLKELPVNIITSIVELEGLFRATAKPTLRNIARRGATTILEQGVEGFQEVNQASSLESAKGNDIGIIDFAFNTNEGFNNLMGGIVGGLSMGAPMSTLGIVKDTYNWNSLYNISTADMQNSVRYSQIANMVSNGNDLQRESALGVMRYNMSEARNEYLNTSAEDKKAKLEAKQKYANALGVYSYATEYAEQAKKTDVSDIQADYTAHNKAVAKQYQVLANNASKDNKNEYQKQADYYASLADKSEQGKQVPIYSFNTDKGRVFISERTAKTLAEGSIKEKNDAFDKAVENGAITGVQVIDDNESNKKLTEKFLEAQKKKAPTIAPIISEEQGNLIDNSTTAQGIAVVEANGKFEVSNPNGTKEIFDTRELADERVVEINNETNPQNNATENTKTENAQTANTEVTTDVGQPSIQTLPQEATTTDIEIEVGKPIQATLEGKPITIEKTDSGYQYQFQNGQTELVSETEHQEYLSDNSLVLPKTEAVVSSTDAIEALTTTDTPTAETATNEIKSLEENLAKAREDAKQKAIELEQQQKLEEKAKALRLKTQQNPNATKEEKLSVEEEYNNAVAERERISKEVEAEQKAKEDLEKRVQGLKNKIQAPETKVETINEGTGTKELPSEPILSKTESKGEGENSVGEAVPTSTKRVDDVVAEKPTTILAPISPSGENGKEQTPTALRDVPKTLSELKQNDETTQSLEKKLRDLELERTNKLIENKGKGRFDDRLKDEIDEVKRKIYKRENELATRRNAELEGSISDGSLLKLISENKISAEDARLLIIESGIEVPAEIQSIVDKNKQNKKENKQSIIERDTDFLGNEKEAYMVNNDKANGVRTQDDVDYYKANVKRAIDKGQYEKDIADGKMTANDAKIIIESYGLKVPKAVKSLLSKEETPPALRDVKSTAKALEVANKTKAERFYPDDKVILTTKDGKEVEVSFRGYNGENKAVIFGSRGSGINQMEVDISQLRAKSKSDKLSKEDRKELLSKIDFQDKNAPSYSEDFTDKELQDLSVKYPKESKLTNKEKQERNDLQIATTPLKRWQEQEYGVDDPNDPINIRLAKEHETAINNIITNDKYSTLISEAYHKAKADGSNPELVKAVESLLSKEQAPPALRAVESKSILNSDANLKGAKETILRNGVESTQIDKPNNIKAEDNSERWWVYHNVITGEKIIHSDYGWDYDLEGNRLSVDYNKKVLDNSLLFKKEEPKSNLLDAILKKERGWELRVTESKDLAQLEAIEKELQTNEKLKQAFGFNGKVYDQTGKDFYSRLNYLKSHPEKVVSEKAESKEPLVNNKLRTAISEGRMTANDAKAIIESAGLEVPKDIESLLSKEQPKAETPTNTAEVEAVAETSTKDERIIEAHNQIDEYIKEAQDAYDKAQAERLAYINKYGYGQGNDAEFDKLVTAKVNAEARLNQLKTAKENLLPLPNKNKKNEKPRIANNDAENELAVGKLQQEDNPIAEPIIEAIEGEAESNDKAKLNEVISKANEIINNATDVVNVPISEIKTNEEEYQGRKNSFSERSANNVATNFDKNKFEPIVLHKHSDGNTYVLSGHSRLEGMKRRGESTIPARYFEGTDSEAKDFALKSNKLGTLQTDLENADYYRGQIANGKTYNAVLTEAKENEQEGSAVRIIDYAHLNPKGKAYQALESLEKGESDTTTNVKLIAQKVGRIRSQNPHLTDAHEQELFDYFSENGYPTDKEIQDPNGTINRSINAVRFDTKEPLNLNKFVAKTAERIQWEKELKELETLRDELKKEVNPSKQSGWSGLKEKAIASLAKGKSKEQIDQAEKDFNSNKDNVKTNYEKKLSEQKQKLQGVNDKIAKHLLREKSLIQGEKNQGSLFSTSKPKKSITKEAFTALTDMLKKAFPKVKFIGREEAEKILADKGIVVNEIRTTSGNIFGFESNGKIWLDETLMNADTPIHEVVGHYGMNIIDAQSRGGDAKATAIMMKGFALLSEPEGKAVLEEVQANPAYANLPLRKQKLEAVATIIGREGAILFEEGTKDTKQSKTFASKVKAFVNSFYEYLKSKIPTLKDKSIEDIQRMDNKEFIRAIIGDAFRGEIVADNEAKNTDDVMLSATKEAEDITLEYNDKGQHLAPNGKPSNLTEKLAKIVRTDAFKNWFGDWQNNPQDASKVVDENGEPIIMYHGTKSNFSEFSFETERVNNRGGNFEGFYFTSDKGVADSYANGNVVIETFLNIKNPLYRSNYKPSTNAIKAMREMFKGKFSSDYIESKILNFSRNGSSDLLTPNQMRELAIIDGYDGMFDGSIQYGEIATFNPNQIKLADGSNTTFNPNTNDIRFSVEQNASSPISEQNKNYLDNIIKDIESGNTTLESEVKKLEDGLPKRFADKYIKYLNDNYTPKQETQKEDTKEPQKEESEKPKGIRQHLKLLMGNMTFADEKKEGKLLNKLKQDTAITSTEVEGENVRGEYTPAELSVMQKQSEEDVKALRESIEKQNYGKDWIDTLLDALEENENNALEGKESYKLNPIRVIGITNNIAGILSQKRQQPISADEALKLSEQRTRLHDYINKVAREASLTLNARRNFRNIFNLARTIDIENQILETALSEDKIKEIERINEEINKPMTDAELNKADVTKTEPPKTKRQPTNKKSNKINEALRNVLKNAKLPDNFKEQMEQLKPKCK